MIKNTSLVVLMGGLILSVLAGCGTQTIDTAALPPHGKATDQPVSPAPEEVTDVPIPPVQIMPEDKVMIETQIQLSSDDESTESVNLARQDLSQRLGVSVDLIMVNAVIGQEFSAEAFHCQTAKERISKQESTQMISGFSILLSVSGRRYEYHASGQTVVFCRPLP